MKDLYHRHPKKGVMELRMEGIEDWNTHEDYLKFK